METTEKSVCYAGGNALKYRICRYIYTTMYLLSTKYHYCYRHKSANESVLVFVSFCRSMQFYAEQQTEQKVCYVKRGDYAKAVKEP